MAKKIASLFVGLGLLINSLLFPFAQAALAFSPSDPPNYSFTVGGYTGDGQLNGAHGLWIDSSGNMYVADTYNNRIQKFDSSGNFLMKFGSLGSSDGQLDNPYGVAVDSSGNIYVADSNNNRIQKF